MYVPYHSKGLVWDWFWLVYFAHAPRLHLFDCFQILLHFLNRFLFAFILCDLFLDGKAEFSALLLQSSVSHDCSEIILICWFWCSRNVPFYYHQYWKQLYCLILCGYPGDFFFKEQHLFEIKIFNNIINVITVTLDQFNSSLLNKTINLILIK